MLLRVLVVGPPLLSLVVLIGYPTLTEYRGLSGLDCSLVVALIMLHGLHRERPRGLGALCLAAFMAKCGYELVTGHAILAPDLGEGVRLLPLAHLAGALLGLLLALPFEVQARTAAGRSGGFGPLLREHEWPEAPSGGAQLWPFSRWNETCWAAGMSRKLLIAALATGVAIDWLLLREMESDTVYSFSVAELVSRDVRDRPVRVQGTLVPGSLCRLDDCGYRFTMREPPGSYAGAASVPDAWPTLPVAFAGCAMLESVLYEPAREHEVIVFGQRCQSCHELQATDVWTRSYELIEYSGGAGAAPPPPLPPRCSALSPRM